MTHEPAARAGRGALRGRARRARARLLQRRRLDGGRGRAEARAPVLAAGRAAGADALRRARRRVPRRDARRGERSAASRCSARPFAGVAPRLRSASRRRRDGADAAAFAALADVLAGRGRRDRRRRARADGAGRRGHAHLPSPPILRAARELCDRHDVLLVADEVFTGYGRTGPMWACDHAGGRARPPLHRQGLLAAACCRWRRRSRPSASFDGFRGDAERAFYYGHSFCGNPLGAAVAREVLRVYEDEKILARARSRRRRASRRRSPRSGRCRASRARARSA